MNYSVYILFGLGLLGILLHNLTKLDSLNRQGNGSVNLAKYWAVERFSIIISVIVITCCVIASQEIAQLKIAGNYLGLGFVSLGYLAQSILVKFMGNAQNIIDNEGK